MSGKLLLIDGNSILNRAFYAIRGPRMLTKADGTPTNAVYGFLNILNKYIEEEKPDYLAVAFDLKAKTFRHSMYEDYKATRKGMPDELAVQLPIVKRVLEAMNISVVEKEGLEADDIIGVLSKQAETDGMDVSILTGDRDALQLVDENITVIIPTTSKGTTTTTRYTPEEVKSKYGIGPESMIELKALMGDSSDNIPGVKGVGEKTALGLIKEFGNIDKLYENISSITKAKLRENLQECKELAYLSRELGTILRHSDGLGEVKELERKEIKRDELLEIFKDLEFNSLIKKMNLDSGDSGTKAMQTDREICCEHIEDLGRLEDVILELTQKDVENDAIVFFLPLFLKTERIGGYLKAICFGTENKSFYIEDIEESSLVKAFKPIFNSESITLVTHNVKELYIWALGQNTEMTVNFFDTMLAEYLIDALAVDYSIPALAGKYLDIQIETPLEIKRRDKQIAMEPETDKLSRFLKDSLSVLGPIYEKQKEILENSGQNKLFYEVEQPLALVLGSMEHHGFKVDQKNLEDYGKRLDHRIRSLEQTIYMLACEEFNINSPKQLGVVLFEKMGLKASKKTKTGYSTDAETLNEISDSHEIIPCILEYRQLTKLKSTYAEGLVKVINPDTGRIHSSFNQTVTSTGRISSTEPNLQNIPIRTELGREIRQAFVPEEGFVFVDADYSQIELRVLAHITGDEMLKKAFTEGLDIHSLTASQVFGVSIDKVTPDMRRSAKAVNFGIVYGIGDFSLAKDIGVTKKEAARYIDGYLSTYPKVRDYMSDIVASAQEKGYVKTMLNRIRYIPELKSPNFQVRAFGKRIAMNTPIQGSAADIIKIAMVKVWRELKKKGLKSRLILQVHDELLVEAAIDELEQVKEIVRCNMESAVELGVPLIADVSTGATWYDAK
jgi:DNA polymerase-1